MDFTDLIPKSLNKIGNGFFGLSSEEGACCSKHWRYGYEDWWRTRDCLYCFRHCCRSCCRAERNWCSNCKSLGITDADPAEVIKKVNHALTYEPPSKTGQKVVDVVSAPLSGLPEKPTKPVLFVAEKTDSPLLGAAVNTGIQALPIAIAPLAKSNKITDTALAKSDAATAIQAGEKAVFNQIADTSKKAGYTVPPSELNPSVMNKTLEGVGDKGQGSD